jgi:hypothetical protein
VKRRAAIFLVCLTALAQTGPPSEDEQREIIGETRKVALNYTQQLPNFTCEQDTDRYVNPHGDKSKEDWKRSDRYTTKLSYNGVKEDYTLIAVNGKPVSNRSLESIGGTISTGDFASALRYIFAPESDAKFTWHSWAAVRGHICYRLQYNVDQRHSRWVIQQGGTTATYQSAYQGIVSIDQETKQVLKLTIEAVGIPKEFPIQVVKEELDYDWAVIGGTKYLLPFNLEVRLNAGKELTRNVSRYENYRKFSADANITFH